MGPENFDQAFVLRPVLFEAFELVGGRNRKHPAGVDFSRAMSASLSRLVSIRSSVVRR